MIDGTIVSVHQKASGAKGGAATNAIGRSRGGLTSKIVALVDALGNLVRFVLLPGQRHDTVGVAPLIDGVSFGALLGAKPFDADWLRADLADRAAAAVIPPRSNRKVIIDYDRERCITGGTWLRTISPNSRSSAPSPRGTTRPPKASAPTSILSPPWSPHGKCQRTLEDHVLC